MHGSTTLRSIKITDLLLILLLVSSAAAKLSEAQCNVVCNPDNEDCDGFLSSLPLRTGPQILTTALVTGLLAAWQSCGSGQGGLLRGIGRTILQAFIPEIALFQLHRLGYAMDPEFEDWIVPTRAACRCHDFQPTKAQIVAVHLRSLAVRGVPRSRTAATIPDQEIVELGRGGASNQGGGGGTMGTKESSDADAANLLRYVADSPGWKDVKFYDSLQPGYRLVSLSEVVFLPHLLYALPKGRRTILGTPVFQPAMVLLFVQSLYFIVYTVTRAAKDLYVTTIEWFFIAPSITLVLLFLSNILWEPAWKDIAHVNIDLGAPLPSYPWTRANGSRLFIGFINTLVLPIGPITTLVAWGTQWHDRPSSTSLALIVSGVLWLSGFFLLGALTLFGHYRPFGGSDPWMRDAKSDRYGMWFSVALVVARTVVFSFAIYELAVLPAEAYAQMTWAQYFPHV